MKKIINDPSTVLDEMNRGFATAYADIVELHDDTLSTSNSCPGS